MRIIPIQKMEQTADLRIPVRHQLRFLVQAKKVMRLPSHTVHFKASKQIKDQAKAPKPKLWCDEPAKREKAVIQDPNCKQLEPDTWTPRRNALQIRMGVSKIEGKKTQNPALRKYLALEIIRDRYRYTLNLWIHALADGSKVRAQCSRGIAMKFPDKTTSSLSVPIGERSSNYRAKLQTLVSATDHLVHKAKQHSYPHWITFSTPICLCWTYTYYNKAATEPCYHTVWTGQCSTPVDTSSCRRGWKWSSSQQTSTAQASSFLQWSLTKPFLNSFFRSDRVQRNNWYSLTTDSLYKLHRNWQTIIFPLYTVHSGLRVHMRRISIVDTA